METSIFAQLSIVITMAVVVSLVMRLLKQPLIMGYILTGILAGPSAFHLIQNREAFESFSEIGIALLLFIIGLGLNAAIIRSLGKVVLLASTIEVAAVGAAGYALGLVFGFTVIESVILALSLIFSSTIIIVKVLSDKKEQGRLYAQITIGILLVEDIIATIALLFVAAAGKDGITPIEVVDLLAKGAILAISLFFVATRLLPRLTKFFASSQEFLFLFAIGWGFGVASLFEIAGFSIEVGALFAGVALASLPYTQEIGARLKPLRDFFVVLFFIVLGESLNLQNLAAGIGIALILSFVALVTKPFFIMLSLGILGYTKRTSFKAAVHLSQISEFSIVLVVLAQATGLVRDSLSAIVTLVAVTTIAISTYFMKYDDKLFNKLESKLRLFERKVIKEEKRRVINYPLMLFGYQKGGHEFVSTFRQIKKKFVIVDYDPEVIEQLERQGLPYVYGDATDIELLEEVGIDKAKLIVSTMTDHATNTSLLRHVRHHNPQVVFISHADTYDQAAELYRLGATYVMLPHLIGSERISAYIKRHGLSHEAFDTYREHHMMSLGRAALHH
jgi:Kef-type K+ transport system membrane component KefB